MLTRLQVTGFKNLVDVDVRFGPFTCIAGANAVGKSNLFDAITFLAALADDEFAVAARKVRNGTTADIRNLFHRHGGAHEPRMRLEAEMIIPQSGTDDLGRDIEAAITFVRYALEFTFGRVEGGPIAPVAAPFRCGRRGCPGGWFAGRWATG